MLDWVFCILKVEDLSNYLKTQWVINFNCTENALENVCLPDCNKTKH